MIIAAAVAVRIIRTIAWSTLRGVFRDNLFVMMMTTTSGSVKVLVRCKVVFQYTGVLFGDLDKIEE